MEEIFKRKVPAGEVIFKEGAAGKCMYHIHSGKVGIYSRYGKKDEKCLTELGAGDPNPYFGEMALVDHAARSATAVALEDCVLGEVKEHNLNFFLRRHPALVLDMLRRMSGHLRVLTDNYMDACHTIAQQEADRQANKKPDPEWLNALKKYTAVFDDPPTEAELAALAVRPQYAEKAETAAEQQDAAELKAEFVEAGTVIFRAGEKELCMYEIQQGSVGIYADYGQPTQKKLTTMTADGNRFFGEMGLIDAMPRSATAVAETDCKLVCIDGKQAGTYFARDPQKLLAVMRQMSSRTRDLTGKYMEAVKTIAENERCAQNGSSKPEWLLKNLKLFADVWNGMSHASGPRL